MLFFSQVSTPLMRILFTELPGTSQNSLCHISRFIPVVEVLCSAIHFLILFLNLQWTWRHWFWFHFSQKVFSDVRFFFFWIWWHDGKRQRPLEVTQGTTGFSDLSSLSLVSCPDLYLRGSPRWHRGSCSASTLERLFVAKLKRHFFHDILAFGKHWNIETFPTSSNLCLD